MREDLLMETAEIAKGLDVDRFRVSFEIRPAVELEIAFGTVEAEEVEAGDHILPLLEPERELGIVERGLELGKVGVGLGEGGGDNQVGTGMVAERAVRSLAVSESARHE